MTLSVHHIAMNAVAPDELAALYKHAVGFQIVPSADRICWLAGPNAFIALHPASRSLETADMARSVTDPGIGHFCIQSGDGPGTWAALSTRGIAFNAAMTSLGGDYLYAYGRDPEANLIEVEGMTADAEPGPPWIAHVALVSADLVRLADFYAMLIGRAPHNSGRFQHPAFKAITGHDDVDVSAQWICADNLIFEMWQYHNPPTKARAGPLIRGAPGYRDIGFCCDDLESECARLADHGIVLTPATLSRDTHAYAGTDPDGNAFTLFQSPAAGEALSLARLSRPGIIADRHRDVLGK